MTKYATNILSERVSERKPKKNQIKYVLTSPNDVHEILELFIMLLNVYKHIRYVDCDVCLNFEKFYGN